MISVNREGDGGILLLSLHFAFVSSFLVASATLDFSLHFLNPTRKSTGEGNRDKSQDGERDGSNTLQTSNEHADCPEHYFNEKLGCLAEAESRGGWC